MNSDLKGLGLLAAWLTFAIYATVERGEGLVINLIICGFITGFTYLIGSCFERNEFRWVVFIIYIFIAGEYIDKAESLKFRKAREREAGRIQRERYQAWYNSLSPYEKLKVDNELLREENARLQQR